MQDSLELLHCFLDGLRTEETEVRKVAKDASNARAPTIVDSIFAGELSIIVGSTAECSHSSVKHDKFLVLSLPVPCRRPPADQVTLVDDNVTVLCCLSLYTELELLSEPWLCEQCTNAALPNICERKNAVEMMDNANERKEGEEMMAGGAGGDDDGQDNQNKQKEDNTKVFRAAKRRIYISKAPHVLVIHLKRLSQDRHDQHEKLKVHLQDKLDIQQFMKDPRLEENGNHDNITYRLVGIVEHMETMEGGHYIAYVRGDKIGGQRQQKSGYKAWFYARDGEVRKVWILQVLDQVLEPDLLFYERVDGGGQFMDSNFPAVDSEPNNTSFELNERNEETTVKSVEGKGYSNPIEVSSPPPDQMDKMGACIYLELNQKLPPPPAPEDIIIPSDGGQKLNHKLQQPLAREDIAIFESAGNLMGEESWLTETHGNVIKGLPNLGNTCFFNVALQNLLALDTLRSKMLGPNVWTGPLAIPLKKLFVETSASNDTGGALSPHILFSYICSRFPQFKGSHMQDSHELLSLFLDGVHTDEIEARKLAQDASNAGVPTIVESIFGGELSSTVSSLECPHSSVKHDQFLDLSLPLPSRKSNSSDHEVDNTQPEYVMALSSNSVVDEVDNSNAAVSVEDCLASYTKEDPLSWHCERCNDKTKVFRAATQRLLISKAPPALMITLKRFRRISSSESKKLEGHVCFEEMLDIGPFMDSRSEENDNTTYRLVGVVQHKGTPIEGHYIAYVRAGKVGGQQHQSSGSKSWFYASDLEVRKASLEEVLSFEAYLLFYERCLTNASQSSVKLTGEGSQLIDVDEQLRSGAPVRHSPPLPPPKKEAPWEFPRGNNRNKRRENAKALEDTKVAQQIGVFLDRFTLSGESMPYYRSQLVGMVERGFGSGDLNILYSHLLSYSKDLAMKVCNGYKRLRVILTETAREFVQQVVTTELNLTETTRKFMLQLVTVESAQSLKLKFLDMPKVHKLLKHCLSGPLLEGMNVYGHKGQPIKTPLPDKCAMIQELLDYVLSKHRAGFSWKGNFTIDDMEVYDRKVVITKCPKSFPKNPRISGKMVTAMEMDFAGIAKSVLQKFLCPGFVVPYLTTFYTMLSGMGSYAEWWCDRVTAEALRELIQHHPFLKPSMARSNLLSGIHGACRSYDTGDETALFKTILQLEEPTDAWTDAFRWELNPVLQKTFRHKDIKMKSDPGQNESDQNEPLEYFGYYQNNLQFLVEYLRNLSQHGTARSFEYRRLIKRDDGTLFDPNPKLRKQFIQSLDELEVAGAVLLDKYVMGALTLLLESSAMKGMLQSVWDCYKNCNSSF